jgi:hypothetical protein
MKTAGDLTTEREITDRDMAQFRFTGGLPVHESLFELGTAEQCADGFHGKKNRSGLSGRYKRHDSE